MLVIISRLLFGGKKTQFDQTTIEDRVSFDEPDFQPKSWLHAETASLTVNDRGEVVAIKAHGDHLITRRATIDDIEAESVGKTLKILGFDSLFGDVSMGVESDEEARAWAMRLTGKGAMIDE